MKRGFFVNYSQALFQTRDSKVVMTNDAAKFRNKSQHETETVFKTSLAFASGAKMKQIGVKSPCELDLYSKNVSKNQEHV